MKWRKLGIVYAPDGKEAWAQTHAMLPTPIILKSGILRIYCAMRDAKGVGRTGYVDLNPDNPLEVLGVSQRPVLDVGVPGTFDENGTIASCVIYVGDTLYMYYAGFELGAQIRYRILTGLATSTDGGTTFVKHAHTPVLERSPCELFFRCSSYVHWTGDRMRMWYIGGSEWTEINGKAMPVYDLKYLESKDGKVWGDTGLTSLSLQDDEHGFGRPCIIQRSENDYQLFFSIRKRSLGMYRLGYAESKNGLDWVRKDDQLGLDVSPSGFDSEAIMYAAPITIGDKTYLFYNGNDFGRDGFAVAERAE